MPEWSAVGHAFAAARQDALADMKASRRRLVVHPQWGQPVPGRRWPSSLRWLAKWWEVYRPDDVWVINCPQHAYRQVVPLGRWSTAMQAALEQHEMLHLELEREPRERD